MRLLAYKIGDTQYLCNEFQIKEAGGLEQAAQKMHAKDNPIEPMKSKSAKAEVKQETESETLKEK